jgi:hypothetical protein
MELPALVTVANARILGAALNFNVLGIQTMYHHRVTTNSSLATNMLWRYALEKEVLLQK